IVCCASIAPRAPARCACRAALPLFRGKAHWHAICERTPAMPRGFVYLIGAGPGNPELMTLAAVRALGEASVVLVDELVDERCLHFTRARIVRVGKRGGCTSTPQRFIEQLM